MGYMVKVICKFWRSSFNWEKSLFY
jgi:hypothetical protein